MLQGHVSAGIDESSGEGLPIAGGIADGGDGIREKL